MLPGKEESECNHAIIIDACFIIVYFHTFVLTFTTELILQLRVFGKWAKCELNVIIYKRYVYTIPFSL